MSESAYAILPAVAALAFLVALVVMSAGGAPRKGLWMVPAFLSLSLLGWTTWAVIREGWLGFWPQHDSSAWAIQIWCDLLLSGGTAVALLLPRARAVGMRVAPWVVLIACSGSIGLLAMVARCLKLEEKTLPEKGSAR